MTVRARWSRKSRRQYLGAGGLAVFSLMVWAATMVWSDDIGAADDCRIAEKPVDDEVEFRRRLDEVLACELGRAARTARSLAAAAAAAPTPDELYLNITLNKWNGGFVWAPASMHQAEMALLGDGEEVPVGERRYPSGAEYLVNTAGDEARSVFGPIPRLHCGAMPVASGGASAAVDPDGMRVYRYTAEVDGNAIRLAPGDSPDELVFVQVAPSGEIVGEPTTAITRCDKPSLAGGTTFCGINSRIVTKVEKSGVQWVMLCRKSRGDKDTIVSNDGHWSENDSHFDLLGVIGFNPITGEVAFFDGWSDEPGSSKTEVFDWSQPFAPPGGDGYADKAGRAEARSTYDYRFAIDCHNCHDNKEPWVRTPHLTVAGIGHRDPARERALSIGSAIPEAVRAREAPYRIIGTGYTRVHGRMLRNPYGLGQYPNGDTIEDPTGQCTTCHTLTTLNTGRVFAFNAVGRSNPPYTHDSPLSDYWNRLASVQTEWSKRTGDGQIIPWMLPNVGGNLGGDPPHHGISDEDWDKLAVCLNPDNLEQDNVFPPGLAGLCQPAPIWTRCPTPGTPLTEATRLADPRDVEQLHILPPQENRNDDNPAFPMEVTIAWKYLNDLGNVDVRDDVRFDVGILAAEIPAGGEDPDSVAFASPAGEDVHEIEVRSVDEFYVRNVSYRGHARYTEVAAPDAPGALRDYAVSFPAQCGKRYSVRVTAKRFCFDDRQKLAYGPNDHIGFVDVICD